MCRKNIDLLSVKTIYVYLCLFILICLLFSVGAYFTILIKGCLVGIFLIRHANFTTNECLFFLLVAKLWIIKLG